MSLSYVVEYLLSMERPGGGRLVYAEFGQLMVPAFPPNTTVTFNHMPPAEHYMHIGYRGSFGYMVPGAFYTWAQQYGSRPVDGIITQWLIDNPFDYFLPHTQAEPVIQQITNLTALNQYYEGNLYWLVIPSEEDHAIVMDALRQLSTSTNEQLAIEINRLLELLVNVSSVTGGR